jgi:hypothetical protein
MRPSSRSAAGLLGFLVVFSFAVALQAAPEEALTRETVLETAEAAPDLPVWQEGDCRESFDVRLWPMRTRIWLERENLRDRIADPALPESERAKLRQLLSVTHRWRMHSSTGNEQLN